jgi:polysaccharide biosynthesis transport protein
LTRAGKGARVILVTSSIPGEGKTVTSTNLAAVFSQANRKVLLVDADLRRGRVGSALSLQRGAGLSELLAGQQDEPILHAIEGLPLLDILQTGHRPPNPADLLDASMLKWLTVWRDQYDFIVLDGPPLLPVSDAQILHPLVDISLLVTRIGLTERVQLLRSYRMLTDADKHFVGIILNGLRPRDEGYYGYYGYREYAHHYAEDDDAKSK